MANLHIRTFEMRDYEQVTALWRAAGLSLSLSDDVSGIEHRIQRDPELFIVAESGGQIVGAVLGCYDGRRGWVNHLAVAPWPTAERHRHDACGRSSKRASGLLGCVKVNLFIEPDNNDVQRFYDGIGYTQRRTHLHGEDAHSAGVMC